MKKSILITGSTDGIGRLAALKLVEEGHKVYVHGRNSDKVSELVSELKGISDNNEIRGFVADFSDLEAVKEMGREIEKELPELDVLINNAGVYNSRDAVNSDGLDMRFTVNYFAPYILTGMLLPILKKGPDTRVINLSSAAQASVSMEALAGEKRISGSDSYAQSKLALTIWSFRLAAEISGIDVIAVNPGSLLNTRMVREAFGSSWSSADKGADILCDLAVSEKYNGETGKYFDNDKGRFGRAHSDAYNEKLTEELIEITEKILK